jgi:hypothetical protein
MFWQKDLGTKAAHKMLVKLTPGNALKGQTLYRFCPFVSHEEKKMFYIFDYWLPLTTMEEI